LVAKEIDMTKFVHIVQVHPVENGLPNLYKVKAEHEFDTEQEAKDLVATFNKIEKDFPEEPLMQAVYLGCVNDATGELV
jgi:hypothetical protein